MHVAVCLRPGFPHCFQKKKKNWPGFSSSGRDITSREFKKFCNDEGIVRYCTVPGTVQQNGITERMNQTLLERTRSMRLCVDLPKEFWPEEVDIACYIINRSPAITIELITPKEVWKGKLTDFSSL